MRKEQYVWLRSILLAILVGVGGLYVTTSNGTAVEAATISTPTAINTLFTDPALAEVVKTDLGKATVSDTVTQTDLDGINSLEADRKGITSIAGVEYLNNATQLNFSYNQITDLTPLANLSKLTSLVMNNNQVADLTPLQNLTSLTDLTLFYNKITDVTPLANLTNLTSLAITGNEISDLTPIGSLTNLEGLSIGDQVTDIKPLDKLTNLKRLNLSDNEITDISPVAKLINLQSLTLDNNQFSDLTPLGILTNLTELSLYSNHLSDIGTLASLTNLKKLNLMDNQISNLAPISNLTNLTDLNLSTNQISDLKPISNLTNLTVLQVPTNQLEDISPISSLPNLEFLTLYTNQISDLSPLENLTKLKQLFFYDNKVSDVSPIANLTSLQELSAGTNQISDLTPLAKLTRLTQLGLDKQKVTSQPVKYQSNLVVPNAVKNVTGALINPATISDNGTYTNPDITWNLPSYTNEVSYTFDQSVTIGRGTATFSGTVTQPLKAIFNVKYHVNGNETATEVESGNLLTEPKAPTKTGYTFAGWFDAETGGTKWDFLTNKMPTNDIDLYAQFTINDYTATLNEDGKTSTQTVKYQELLQEPPTPTKEGYTFKGWYDAKTGGNKWDFTTSKMPAKDITLYAQFSANSYTVTLDVDGKQTKQKADYQSLVKEPKAPTKAGYTFTGWYDAEKGGNKWDFASDKMPANDITLYAQFTKDPVTPPNQPNNGGSGSTPSGTIPGNNTSNTQMGNSQSATGDNMNGYDPYNAYNYQDQGTGLPTTGDSDNAIYILLGLLLVATAFAITKKVRTK
ncbi:leucine-rich repeat domain-containing protein [Listeria ivanovii]|uniref:leucine-rich repeat domain-containing protein n=1 Tax=Listeria ivanovii TaxID=1638 RepID=UPI00194357C4|nr:LPXTG cell wall anchor domain-containing protein [Listeria ivanovii]